MHFYFPDKNMNMNINVKYTDIKIVQKSFLDTLLIRGITFQGLYIIKIF